MITGRDGDPTLRRTLALSCLLRYVGGDRYFVRTLVQHGFDYCRGCLYWLCRLNCIVMAHPTHACTDLDVSVTRSPSLALLLGAVLMLVFFVWQR